MLQTQSNILVSPLSVYSLLTQFWSSMHSEMSACIWRKHRWQWPLWRNRVLPLALSRASECGYSYACNHDGVRRTSRHLCDCWLTTADELQVILPLVCAGGTSTATACLSTCSPSLPQTSSPSSSRCGQTLWLCARMYHMQYEHV